jgi:ribosomal protein S18 acetylase RimI-like enzyme
LTVAACNDKAVKMYERFGFVAIAESMDEWRLEGDDGTP